MSRLGPHEHDVRAHLSFPWETPPAPGYTQEVAPGVLWLRMPLPFSLDHINLYLLEHDKGWVVVDTGLNLPQSREVWERVFTQVFQGVPIVAVIATHFHYDHCGLLGWLVNRFQCPAYMSLTEYQAMFVTPPKDDSPNWAFTQFYQRTGLAPEQVDAFRPMLKQMSYEVDAPTSFNRLSEGDVLNVGARRWRVVIGSGHSPEHVCLYSEDDQLLIAGDQILPRITSSVSVMVTEPEANPLKQWFDSLQRFRSLPDSVLVLPAHERPFYGLHHRLGQLQHHHDAHLDALLAALDTPKTVSQLRQVLFPKAKSSFDLMMSIGETLAHINYLMSKGVVGRELDMDVWQFTRLGNSSQSDMRA